MALTAVQIKKLDREVCYKHPLGGNNRWYGKSNGIIVDNLYLVVYPADSIYNEKPKYKKVKPINIPLTQIYYF